MPSPDASITPVHPAGAVPGGHYSPGVVHGDLVYVSGQVPAVPGARDRTVGSIEDQTRQVLQNVAAVLDAAGSGLDQVLSMTIYITDIGLWPAVNRVYAEVMGEHRPARAIVPVGELHYGYQIEVQATAVVSR